MAQTSSLGDFVRVRTGKLDANAAHENGKYPFFTCSKEPLAINAYSFDCECVLLAGNGEFHVSYYSGPFDAYQRTYVIESLDVERLSVQYLYYFMRYYSAELRKLSVGGVIKFIKLGNIKDAPIPVPSVEEQRRIVDLLSRADGIVRLRREAEKKAAELIPTLFLDMFGDPATNPKGWPVAPLSTICDKCSTNDPRKTPQAGFTYIDIAAIDNDRGCIVEPKPMLGADAPSRARQIVKAGDVIVSTVRPNLRGSAVVPDDLDGQICSTGFCVLRPKATTASAFVFALARSDWFVDEMMKKVRGAQYPAVTDKDLFNHPIPIPPFPGQQEFAARFAEIVSIQNQQSTATAQAQAAFDALLAQAFSANGAAT